MWKKLFLLSSILVFLSSFPGFSEEVEIDWQKKYLETQLKLDEVITKYAHALFDVAIKDSVIKTMRNSQLQQAVKETKATLDEYIKVNPEKKEETK